MLAQYRPEAVRFLFLLHKYHEPMEYSENTMAAAADLERRFATFSTSLRAFLREDATAGAAPGAEPPCAQRCIQSSYWKHWPAVMPLAPGLAPGQVVVPTIAPPERWAGQRQQQCSPHYRFSDTRVHKWGAEERQLSTILHEKRAEVDAALRASIDTPAALKALEQLVRATNTYMNEVGPGEYDLPVLIGERIAEQNKRSMPEWTFQSRNKVGWYNASNDHYLST